MPVCLLPASTHLSLFYLPIDRAAGSHVAILRREGVLGPFADVLTRKDKLAPLRSTYCSYVVLVGCITT